MNVTNITTDDQIKYDPFLVETIVKPKDKEKVHSNRVEDNNNWDSNILKDTLSNLENNIQQSEDSSPLSYSSAPPLTSNQEASNLIDSIDRLIEVRNQPIE